MHPRRHRPRPSGTRLARSARHPTQGRTRTCRSCSGRGCRSHPRMPVMYIRERGRRARGGTCTHRRSRTGARRSPRCTHAPSSPLPPSRRRSGRYGQSRPHAESSLKGREPPHTGGRRTHPRSSTGHLCRGHACHSRARGTSACCSPHPTILPRTGTCGQGCHSPGSGRAHCIHWGRRARSSQRQHSRAGKRTCRPRHTYRAPSSRARRHGARMHHLASRLGTCRCR